MQLDALLHEKSEGLPVKKWGLSRVIFTAAEALFVFRFLFKLFGMSEQGAAAKFVFAVTASFSGFFSELFPPAEIGGLFFEWPALVAAATVSLCSFIFANMVLDQRRRERPESSWP